MEAVRSRVSWVFVAVAVLVGLGSAEGAVL
jgi:hypothetical protein